MLDQASKSAKANWVRAKSLAIRRFLLRPAPAGSHERLFHEAGIPRLLLPLRTDCELSAALGG